MTALMDHSSIDNSKHASYDQGREETSLCIHSVKKASVNNCSKKHKCLNAPSSLGVFTAVWKFFPDNFLKILVERIFWWPSFFKFLFIDLILSEDLPDLVAVRMVRFNEPGAVTASSKSYGVSTTWMLSNELSEIKLLTMDDPVIWINLLDSAEVMSTESETLIGRVVSSTGVFGFLVFLLVESFFSHFHIVLVGTLCVGLHKYLFLFEYYNKVIIQKTLNNYNSIS